MESMDPRNSDSQNERLDQVVADYVRAVETGDSPDRDELFVEHSDLADDLREFFRHRDRMEALLDPLRSAAARVLNVRCPHCHHAIELVDNEQVTDLSCPSCGSRFSLVGTASAECLPDGLKRIGQFQLVEQVGIGQFGSVWKARDLALERFVAIKIPRSGQLNEAETEMFLRDARLAAQLNHPNIVGVHEVGKQGNTIYIVSDFVQGAALKEWIAAKRLTIREAAQLCVTMAQALHHAHESGVIHRDLKPGNIMMDLAGDPHIVDFGLAKRDSGEITMTLDGQILGTPAYMSPEQAGGDAHHADRKADIYSLGVILFELLTGELPFRGDKQMLLVQILNEAPPSPQKLNTNVPRDLETICLKCLEKEPHRRYDTAQAFADDCARFLIGEPVLARPVSRLSRGWRWCRRKPLVAGLSAAVAALLVGIAVVSSIGFRTTQTALEIAQDRADTIEKNLYYSEMNRAGIAARDPEGLAQVDSLLAKWQPQRNRVDRRGWEWYYLDSLLHQDLTTFQAHEGAVLSAAWSPEGTRLATTSGLRVKIWGNDGEVIHTLAGHTDQVNSVDWNKAGTRLASASYDGAVKIWDTDRGELVNTLRHEGQVVAASWSHDDEQLAVASLQHPDTAKATSTVTVWSSSAWEKQQESGPAPTQIDNLRWHPHQSRIAIGSSNGVRIWDPRTGEETRFEGRRGHVAWNHDGTRLATRNFYKIDIWDVAEQKKVAMFDANSIGNIAWSPRGPFLAFSVGQKVVKLYDMSTETELLTLRGHRTRVTTICWHPSGERIATASADGVVEVWSTTNRTRLFAGSRAISWNPDGSQYVSRFNKSVLICSPASSQSVMRLDGHTADVFTVSWSPDGLSVASGSFDGEVRVWNAATGELRRSVKTLAPDFSFGSPLPTVLAWSPDSRHLAFPQADYAIGIIDAKTGEQIQNLKGHTDVLRSLAWSPNGSRIVAGGYDRMLRVWDPVTGRLKETRNIRVYVNAVCWSPDGSRIAGATSDNNIYIWNSFLGQPLHRLSGHTTYVHAVSWSPDGQRIASADESGSIRIWDAATGQQTLTLSYPHAVPIVAWNPDGKQLACAGFGGTTAVRIWNATVDRSEGVHW